MNQDKRKPNSQHKMSRQQQVAALLLTSFCGVNATPAIALGFYNPYVGFDIQERHMQYKRGFGDNMLKSTAPQGNIYAGIKLKDSLALEIGFEATRTRSRTVTLHDGDVAAGVPIVALTSPAVFRSIAKVRGPHIDIVGFHGFAVDPAFKLLGSIGMGVFRGSFERTTLQYGPSAISGTCRTLSKNKAVLRLLGGMQYMFGEHIGARLTVGWTNTTRVAAKSCDNCPTTLTFKPKNTVSYGAGLLWVF
jgi:hypothetical protein